MRGHVWPCFSLTVAALADFRLHVYAVDGICVAETVRMQIAGVPNLAASSVLASDLFLSLATAAVCVLRRTACQRIKPRPSGALLVGDGPAGAVQFSSRNAIVARPSGSRLCDALRDGHRGRATEGQT